MNPSTSSGQAPRLPLTLSQLRALVRNAEARVDHLTEWAQSLQPGDFRPQDLTLWIEAAHMKLVHHRARLAGATLLAECVTAQASATPEPVLQHP